MSEVAAREASNEDRLRSSGADFLWTSLGLVEPLAARVSGGVPAARRHGRFDRHANAEPGDLFFAINGVNSDGHDHVAGAFAKGALRRGRRRGARRRAGAAGPLYVVRDVLPALERLGVAARARTEARVVAVTGSVGKTSTKEALAAGPDARRRGACLGRLLQ